MIIRFDDRFKIGVIASAAGDLVERLKPQARIIGEEIANHDCILVTGGCPGLSYEAAIGASLKGGIVIGISPAMDPDQHEKLYKFPTAPFIMIYIGSEKKGRIVPITRTCDGVIAISGRGGTLVEFLTFYEEGNSKKVAGLLTGSGGVVDHEISSYIERTRLEKPSRITVVENQDPKQLVSEVVRILKEKKILGS